jgi:hypothetical protein
MDETPLPKPMPYHLADRTSQPSRISSGDLDLPLVEGADTRPGHEERRSDATTTTGLAQAARRISGLLDSKGVPVEEMDLSAELDTRQRARIPAEQLEKIDMLPATPPLDVPVASFIDRLDLDDLTTPAPGDDLETAQVRQLTPIPRGSEDALTPPPLASPKRGTRSVPPPAGIRPAPAVRAASPTSPPSVRRAAVTAQPIVRPAPATSPPLSSPSLPRPSVPTPAKRPTPSVPSLANRATPAMPIASPVKRPTPSVPPLTRSAPSGPRPRPISLPPPPASDGTPSRPSLVAVIPPKGAASRSSITIETRGPTSNPPTDVDDELTLPRDRLGLDDDD